MLCWLVKQLQKRPRIRIDTSPDAPTWPGVRLPDTQYWVAGILLLTAAACSLPQRRRRSAARHERLSLPPKVLEAPVAVLLAAPRHSAALLKQLLPTA